MNRPLLEIIDLRISFGDLVVVDGINLTIEQGQSLAIVGESGSGKSVTALSTIGLLPKTAVVEGQILFKGNNICTMNNKQLRNIRGNKIAMIFQEPMSSLNPVYSIGEQIMETLLTHEAITHREAKQRTFEALDEVGIETDRFKSYPHEFSGGMRQRVMIAIALACKPSLLIADEPTTALDASTSRQIVDLLLTIQQNREMAILFITHDLCIVPTIAQNICVMRHGIIVEKGETKRVLEKPKHKYTSSLIACVPSLYTKCHRLQTIESCSNTKV